MRLVEKHIVKNNRFEDICLKSGLLYNYVLYNVRQGIFYGNYLNEYEFSTKLCHENQTDFRNLPTPVSQQVIGQVFKAIRTWMKLKKDFEKNPAKYDNNRPNLPKYKIGKKQNMVVFTTNACKIKEDGFIHFVKDIIEPIKTNVKKDELKQVRIVPQATCYVVEVVYEREEENIEANKENFLSIDLGLNNLCTCISNVGVKPFIINGKAMKSVNRWYNKKKAELMSFVGNDGTSNRIRKITLFRNCWIEDKLHKISRYIVDFCKANDIGKIIIGHNKEWKQEINIGKRNNQNFVSIPHSKLIDKITYKAKLSGIEVITHEESYTSKVDHLALEPLKKQDVYLGKRKKRGLFQSSVGKLLNADINGAIGIARKVIGDSCVSMIIDSGFAFNPVRVNVCDMNVSLINKINNFSNVGIKFFNSKESLEAKARDTKTRKLSIDKNGVVLVSVKNLEWMGVKDAVLVGMEEGKKFEDFKSTKFYIMPSTVEDERSFILDYLSKDYFHIYLKNVLDEIGWDIGDNDYASYNIIKQEDNLFCLVPKDVKKSIKRKKNK